MPDRSLVVDRQVDGANVTLWSFFSDRHTIPPPGYCRNLGHRDALHPRRHRDEATIKAPAEGDGPVFTPTHRTAGEGWDVPQAGTDRPEQSGLG